MSQALGRGRRRRRLRGREQLRFLLAVPAPVAVALASVAGAVLVLVAVLVPSKGVPILLVVVLGIVVLVRPTWALVLVFLLTPFHDFIYGLLNVRYGVPLNPFTYWKDGLLAVLLLRAAIPVIARRGLSLPSDPLVLLVIGYALSLAVVAATSPDIVIAGYGLEEAVSGIPLFLAILLLRPSRRVVVACLLAMLAVVAVMGGFALWEQSIHDALGHFFGKHPETEVTYHTGNGGFRSGSLFGDPLYLAFYLASTIPIVVGMTWQAARQWRLPIAALTGLGLGGLVVTYTRSGYAGCVIGLIAALGLGIPSRRIATLLATYALTIAVSAAGLAIVGGDDRVIHAEDNLVHIQRLQADLDLLVANPLGLGLGNLDYVGRRFETSIALQTSATESIYLNRALEAGAPSLALFLIVLFSLGMRLRRLRLQAAIAGDDFARTLSAGALGGLLAYCVAGVNLPVSGLFVQVVVWGSAALAIVASEESPARARAAASDPAPPQGAPVGGDGLSRGPLPREAGGTAWPQPT